MPDRLEEIKNAYAVDAATYPAPFKQSHIGWLVAEVERLRLFNAVLRRDAEEIRACRIADLEVISDYCKALASTLRGIDPNNPAASSVTRVSQVVANKLSILRERKISGG